MITRDLFFSLDNPVIFSILISIVIAGLLYLFYVYIYNPLQEKHTLEKENLQLRNSRLMAMFAELDPEPLFRFDLDGNIIFTNESGGRILNQILTDKPKVPDLINIPDINYKNFIENGHILVLTAEIKGEFYDVTLKGIPETGFGQIYCNDITIRKNAEEELEKSRRRLRELSAYIQKAQEGEKQKIARELHDNFGQILTSIKMNIQLLNQNNPDEAAKQKYNEINQQLEEARNEIRELAYSLRPRVLDDFGLAPALKMLCEDVARKTDIKSLFQCYNLNKRLDPETETNIYRIVQEALNNIAKHSRASEFNVQLIGHTDKIVVSIDDDGVGFDISSKKDLNKKNGMGMINMSERALSFNGNFSINSNPGQGTEIFIEIPLPAPYEQD